MDLQPPKYRSEFFKSPHHAGLGLATLGAGFVLGATFPLALLVAPAAYALGWVYLPDMPLFRRWVDSRRNAEQHAASLAEATEFLRKRDELLSRLSGTRRQHYQELASVCRDIEAATADQPLTAEDPSADPRLRKLDELMWTFLRMLTIEESLDRFLEMERRENVPELLREAEHEAAELSAQHDALKGKAGQSDLLESKQRLLSSRLERLEVLRKRLQRFEQTQANLQLVVSEQERLEQQIKLIRADAIASKNTGNLTARIDATVEHLGQTNRWLAEMDEFKDLVGDLPSAPVRLGYEAKSAMPPRLPQQTPGRVGERR
jgi:hypothetical protein